MTGPQDNSEAASHIQSRVTPRVGVVLPAAGSGSRMGGVKKAFLELAGEPVLSHALRPFLSEPRVVAVVVALAPVDAVEPPAWIALLDERVQVIAGGETRTDSVRNAIAALPHDVDIIAVHDAARPLVTPAMIAQCIDVACAGRGAVTGCPAADTMKQVDEGGRVVGTPPRATMWHAHTPQVFPADLLRRAYGGGGHGTDDAALVESVGGVVQMIDGGSSNIKVTRADDVLIAEAILAARHHRA